MEICKRCKTPVIFENVSEGYYAVCPEHNEDLYKFEVEGQREDVIDPCYYCGDSTAFGYGKFVNRLPVEDGWGCGECSGFMCDGCDKQIYLDCDITDKEEWGHYHPKCLPLDQHYVDPEEDSCYCELHHETKED